MSDEYYEEIYRLNLRIAELEQPIQRCKCCGYLVTESEHRGCLKSAAQAEEIERLKQRIADMELAFASQAKTAIAAIDNAKATASHMLKLAEEKEKALNPALLESEREANAILTNRVQELEQSLRDAPEDAEIGRFLLRHATEWTRKPYISDYENEAPYAVMGLRVPYDTDLSSIGMRRYAVQQAMKALEQKKC